MWSGFQYRLVYHFCWPNDRRMDLSIYRITSSNLVYFLVRCRHQHSHSHRLGYINLRFLQKKIIGYNIFFMIYIFTMGQSHAIQFLLHIYDETTTISCNSIFAESKMNFAINTLFFLI